MIFDYIVTMPLSSYIECYEQILTIIIQDCHFWGFEDLDEHPEWDNCEEDIEDMIILRELYQNY